MDEDEPNTTGLAAILFITRSRPGPKLVYHYPGVPSAKKLQFKRDKDHDRAYELQDYPSERPGNSTSGLSGEHPRIPPKGPDTVLGFEVDVLERLLSPGRYCHRRKFEVTVDGWTFVGHPVYAYDNSNWTRQSESKPPKLEVGQESQYYDYLPYETGEMANDPVSVPEPGPTKLSAHRFQHVPNSLEAEFMPGTSMDSVSTLSEVAIEGLTMFHVVCVISTTQTTCGLAKGIYRDVAKPIAEALRYCQKQNNYVARNTGRILSVRARRGDQVDASTLALQIANRSEMAGALKEIYDNIARDKTAGVRLGGYELSLQSAVGRDARAEGSKPLLTVSPHTTLLLAEAKEKMLGELSHPNAAPLAYLVREQTPTKSLQKHATSLGLPLNDVLCMARHLVKWRKATTIAPLHPRNIYICSPSKASKELERHVSDFAHQFAALPSLPDLLKMLSLKPIQFGLLIPTRDHRAPYMDMLAYLVWHGLAVQLRTFAWLKLPRDAFPIDLSPTLDRSSPKKGLALLSLYTRTEDDDNSSQVSDQTAIPLSPAYERRNPHTRDEVSRNTTKMSDEPVMVKDPSRLTNGEAAAASVVRDKLPDATWRELFPALLPHLNGEHAMEEVAAQEGFKRSTVEGCLNHLERTGCLMTVRAL